MTVIAFKDGIMACDGRWTYNKTIDVGATKIRRLKSGGLIGSAGDNDSREVEDLFQNVKNRSQLPKASVLAAIRCNYLGLLALPRGGLFKIAAVLTAVENWDKDFEEEIGIWEVQAPTAIGSGGEGAQIAMACGKSAEQACRMMHRFDPQCGPPYYAYDLHKPEKAKP